MERIIVTLICKEISIANGCGIFFLNITVDLVISLNDFTSISVYYAQTQTLFASVGHWIFLPTHAQ